MGLGLVAVVFLIMEVLFSTLTAVSVGLAIAILIAFLWFALPLTRRMREAAAGERDS
jgi:ABC-type bacteriocin/lantibiotic exporter with double-glycine peptidase domain